MSTGHVESQALLSRGSQVRVLPGAPSSRSRLARSLLASTAVGDVCGRRNSVTGVVLFRSQKIRDRPHAPRAGCCRRFVFRSDRGHSRQHLSKLNRLILAAPYPRLNLNREPNTSCHVQKLRSWGDVVKAVDYFWTLDQPWGWTTARVRSAIGCPFRLTTAIT